MRTKRRHGVGPAQALPATLSSFPACIVPKSGARCAVRASKSCIAAVFAVALLLSAAQSAAGAEPVQTHSTTAAMHSDPFAGFIAEASQRFGIPSSWIRAVMKAESLGDVHAVSPKGAMGLMQIMPETWAYLRARYGFGANPYDPHDNIMAGAAYLRELHDRYGTSGFLAAYNAGPARYESSLATGRPLPQETRAYIAGLAPLTDGGVALDATPVAVAASSWTASPLFAVHTDDSFASSRRSPDRQSTRGSSGVAPQDWTALAPQSAGLFVRVTARNAAP
jgi:Transglycosylase SLT domain